MLVLFLTALFSCLLGLGLAQSSPQIHTVFVGVNGSFFTPSTVTANVSDTVQFVFGADVHAVTQSTFENPCSPLSGGFGSGLAGAKGAGFSGSSGEPVPVWDLVITNASAPIYYMCDSIDPVYHCTAGMVGIINPPNAENFNAFAAAARQTNFTPTVTPSVALSGNGAFATNSPSATASSTQSSASAANATAAVTSNTSDSTTKTQPGVIAGAVVGGIVLLGILVILIVRQYRRKLNFVVDRFTFYRPPNLPPPISIPDSPPSARFPPQTGRISTASRGTHASRHDGEKSPRWETGEEKFVMGEAPAARFMNRVSAEGSIHSSHPLFMSTWRNEGGTSTLVHSQLESSRSTEEYELSRTGTVLSTVTPSTATTLRMPKTPPSAVTIPPAPTSTPPSPGRRRPLPSPITPPSTRTFVPPPPTTPSPAYSYDDPLAKQQAMPPPPVPAIPQDAYTDAPTRRRDSERFRRKMMMMGDGAVTRRTTDDGGKGWEDEGLPGYVPSHDGHRHVSSMSKSP